MDKKHWVMDYETLYNCFTGVFEHYKTQETKIFVIHDLRNDFNAFVTFLQKCVTEKEWHISYNGLAFDAQVTHYVLDNHNKLQVLFMDVHNVLLKNQIKMNLVITHNGK